MDVLLPAEEPSFNEVLAGFDTMDLLLPRPAITDYRAWRRFVNHRGATRPERLTVTAYEGMSKEDRAAYNQQRRRYHAEFGPLDTPRLNEVHKTTLDLINLNYRAAPGARPGVILDGFGTTGKSTIVTQLGRKYEIAVRRKLNLVDRELPNGHLYLPVIYVSLPGNVTIKAFNWLVIEFLGVPAPRSASEDWLTRQIIKVANACGTSLFIIDDVHFVKMRNRTGETINNHLKSLANSISATFVYAGIDLKGTKLLSEGASREREATSQTKRRFKRFEISRFEKRNQEYLSLLGSFEHHLILLKQPSGAITGKLADYIHDRTNGYMGATSDLLREGANKAIEVGEEKLSVRLLDLIPLDYGAEEHRETTPSRRKA